MSPNPARAALYPAFGPEAWPAGPAAPALQRNCLGWDIGGAHVKACWLQSGGLSDSPNGSGEGKPNGSTMGGTNGSHDGGPPGMRGPGDCSGRIPPGGPVQGGPARVDPSAPATTAPAWRVMDIAQWPCPLWRGLAELEAVLALARQRWGPLMQPGGAQHAATMTGEMADGFGQRQDGVTRIAATLEAALGPTLRWYAGPQTWLDSAAAARAWPAVASANWQATAQWVARQRPQALLLDIGSTTTDLIAIVNGRWDDSGHSDAQRLARGSLLYQGVVRTPLCALGDRVPFDLGTLAGPLEPPGLQPMNVMNELFATTADVYRLTGELDPAHDQQPSADGAAKDAPATRQRLARMIGLDAQDASSAQWLALAQVWRARQCAAITHQVERLLARPALRSMAADAPIVMAGCGDFLGPQIGRNLGRPLLNFVDTLWVDGRPVKAASASASSAAALSAPATSAPSAPAAGAPPATPLVNSDSGRQALHKAAQLCAPAVAVALLAAQG